MAISCIRPDLDGRSFWTVLLLGGLTLAPLTATAQDPASSRAQEQAQAQADKAAHTVVYKPNFFERTLLNIEEEGGFASVKTVAPALGGIKAGSGIALGPAIGHQFGSGALVQGKAVFSIRRYKLLQAYAQSAPFLDGRLLFDGRLRWQDAPQVAFYGIGPDAPNVRTDYAERKTEVSGRVRWTPVRFIRLGGGVGFERFQTGPGDSSLPSTDEVFTSGDVPGLDADPKFVHSYVQAAIDTRTSPGYSRSGSFLGATLHDYREHGGGPYTFQRTEAMAEQMIPILRGNWVIDLSARVWTTQADSANAVPFFLLPDLGGGDRLRGYANYRFRDRHALLLTAEYRWYAQEYVDGVLFVDAGKVAARRADLDLDGLTTDYGVGVNFHSPSSTVLRLQLAHGREGFKFILAFSPVNF